MTKKNVRATKFYSQACSVVATTTKYIRFLNKEPNQLDLVKSIGTLVDLENSVEAFLGTIRETKENLTAKFSLAPPEE